MKQAEVTLKNRSGLHARPAAQFVHAAGKFADHTIKVIKKDREVDGKSIIGIMSLGAQYGAVLTICVDGPEEAKVMETLVALVESGLGEG